MSVPDFRPLSWTARGHVMSCLVNTPTRICCTCGRTRPEDCFRRRSRNSPRRHSQCRNCHAASERARTLAQKHVVIEHYVRRLNRLQSNAVRVTALTRALTDRMGGLEGVVSSMMRWYADVVKRKDLDSQLRFFSMLTRLIQVSEVMNRDGLSNEEQRLSDVE